MPLKTDRIEEPNLNLTPMIDIVFLLIIFFMVGTQFTQAERQYDVQVPTVTDAQPLTGLPDEITVNVRHDGEVVVRGRPRTLAELEADLKAAKANYADQAVVIRGEAGGPYQNVMDVLAVCHRAEIRAISLANRIRDER
jgi:biopolymer transport protein ExbD